MLAVIVLNWNGGDDTRRCLESLATSTLPHRAYLVDNGSTDGSQDALVADVVIRNRCNLGFAGGCNTGAWQAIKDGATQLFFLNNDATLAPGTLEKLHAALVNENVVAVSPRILVPLREAGGVGSDEGVRRGRQVWFECGALSLQEFVIARHVEGPGPTDFCSGCALLIRAADFERVGGFDEALFAYYEDIDLCLKLASKGTCQVIPDALAWHKGSASTGGRESPRSLFYTFRNSRTVALRHGSPEQKQQYERAWLRQGLWLASFVGGRSKNAGAAALLGMLCARIRPSGEMPHFPLWLLWPLALLNQKLPRRDRMAL